MPDLDNCRPSPMTERQRGERIVPIPTLNIPSAARRRNWQTPRLVRLAAGSAEDGSSNNEDGSFSAS